MPRKPKNKTGDPDQNVNTRNSEESGMNKPGRSASMGEEVEETKYDKDTREDEADEVDVTDDEDEDESASRRK